MIIFNSVKNLQFMRSDDESFVFLPNEEKIFYINDVHSILFRGVIGLSSVEVHDISFIKIHPLTFDKELISIDGRMRLRISCIDCNIVFVKII